MVWTRPVDDRRLLTLGGVILLLWLGTRLRLTQEALLRREREIQELQRALRVKDEFLTYISHDLRSPLATIRGNAQLLRRRAHASASPAPEWLLEGTQRIEATVNQLTSQVDELLDLAQLSAGQVLALRLRATDLVSLANRAAAAHQQTHEAYRITLETSHAAVVVLCDPARIHRVLDNLLSNAVKFSPKGSEVVVGVSREIRGDEEWAVLRVRDKGVGIPMADLEHVFEPFERASNVGQRFLGRGIGLSASRQIVAQHGGSIEVASAQGMGSTFTVWLPLVPSVG